MIRTRIAPSPTGENLHIGNVYTGLLNYAFSKKHNGKFIIRIEDTDRTRYVEGSEERILASLRKLNLDYDEGPDIGGPYAPYRQSERLEIYHKYAEELIAKGHAEYAYYPKEGAGQKKDYKTQENIATAAADTTEAAPENIEEMVKRGDWVVRMKIPQNETIVVPDVIRGDIGFDSSQLSAQVLIKSDGYPTYHMGVVVDDHLMKITHIIRAEEWISSTPKHILLYRYFGWELPVFAHVPLLRNSDRSKLSKRKNPVWVSWYLEEGFLPEAIINYLALLGWSHPEEKELFTLDEFIAAFDLQDLKPVGPIFDLVKLAWLNGMWIRQLPAEDLKKRLLAYYANSPEMRNILESNYMEALLPLVQTRMKTLREFKELVIADTEHVYSEEEKKLAAALLETIEQQEVWKAEEILLMLKKFNETQGLSMKHLYILLTGRKQGLPLPAAMEILGKDYYTPHLKKII